MKEPSRALPVGSTVANLLSESHVFKDYEEAFVKASGLSLALREPMDTGAKTQRHDGSPFCAMMSHHESCQECLRLQRQLEGSAQSKPSTLKCFAHLCETAIPIRINHQLIAFLETGHVHLTQPSQRSFSKVARAIMNLDATIDIKRAEEAWLATRVICPEKYEAFIKLLAVFTHHLEVVGLALLKNESVPVPSTPVIDRAQQFIADHLDEDLVLGDVAKAVNLSAHYFCKQFKRHTGMSFLEYLSLVRTEKACDLLRNPELRIAEVCYQAGFQSVSQFNRVFRRIIGKSPTDYRLLQARSPIR